MLLQQEGDGLPCRRDGFVSYLCRDFVEAAAGAAVRAGASAGAAAGAAAAGVSAGAGAA